MSHHTGEGGGYGQMSQNDTGGRWGCVKNRSKKCHVLFEWPLIMYSHYNKGHARKEFSTQTKSTQFCSLQTCILTEMLEKNGKYYQSMKPHHLRVMNLLNFMTALKYQDLFSPPYFQGKMQLDRQIQPESFYCVFSAITQF